MGELYRFTDIQILGFALILMRVGAFLLSWPVLSGGLIPRPIQVLTAIAIGVLLFPVVAWKQVAGDLESNAIVWLVTRELLIGISLGLLSRFFILAVSICGEIVGITMGLTGAQIFNPSLGTRSSVIQEFQTIMASLYFLAIQGHHMFLSALVKTYEVVPISNASVSVASFPHLAMVAQEFTVAGVKLAAPVITAVFLSNVTMGIVGRAVPQINVLITSLPVNILMALFILIVSLPMFIAGMEDYVQLAIENSFNFVKSF
ncbi:MAG: flagellar biosynthetic protein FliR [Bdellovibrionales bacterium]|nr:flagellar biosynthetic protein FliR [Bdellovibrionales bacterium]